MSSIEIYRYSPAPPEEYRPLVSGVNVTPLRGEHIHDTPLWNLIWLAVPEVDALREAIKPGMSEPHKLEAVKSASAQVGHQRVALCKVSIDYSDHLRWIMGMEPGPMLASLAKLNLDNIAIFSVLPSTIDVVVDRAKSVMVDPVVALPSNVVYVDFFKGDGWLQ